MAITSKPIIARNDPGGVVLLLARENNHLENISAARPVWPEVEYAAAIERAKTIRV